MKFQNPGQDISRRKIIYGQPIAYRSAKTKKDILFVLQQKLQWMAKLWKIASGSTTIYLFLFVEERENVNMPP